MKQSRIIFHLDRKGLWLAIFCSILFFIQGYFGNLQKSLTWDEPSFISAGYTYLKWGEFKLNPSHPPLMQDLAALPLLFMDLKAPKRNDPSWKKSVNPVVTFGHQFFFENGNDFRKMAFWARLPVLLIGSVMILAIYLWGRELYGPVPAMLATFLATLSPNLLAHAKVATEDLGCTAFMFISVWTLWLCLNKDKFRYWVICGFATGLALISKYTALILGPIYLLLIIGFYGFKKNNKSPVEILKGLFVVCILSYLIIGASYNFSFGIASYVNGLSEIYKDTVPNFLFYLWGKTSEKPFFYYNPAAFLVKVPIPIIVLLVLSALIALRSSESKEATLFLLVPALVIIAICIFDQKNLGIRRILPSFPFLYLFIGVFLTGAVNRRKILVIAVMICWMIFGAWKIYPHHLSYFNILAGGPKGGPYFLDDSNIDWGQDLPSLAAWQEKHPKGNPIKLLYFGTSEPSKYGVNSLPVEEYELLNPQSGFYAVSANYLVGLRKIQRSYNLDVDWLSKYSPVDYIGYSIYIYEFP
jgi:hypothetical protein